MHTLIVGVGEAGKTIVGMRLAELHRKQGFNVIVLTSLWEKWPSDYQTTEEADFIDTFWSSRNCVVFIDEGAETVGHYNSSMKLTATKGRHWGHSCYYLVQRPTLIDPTVRGMCSQLFCFAQGQDDAESLAKEWVQPDLVQATQLRRGEYFRCLRFGPDGARFIERGSLWTQENLSNGHVPPTP